jgi:predicted ester cyclase
MGELEARNKLIVTRFGEAQASRRLDLFDDLMAPDFIPHCQATPWVQIRSIDDFKRFLQEDWASVPDGHITPVLLIAEGGYVALYCIYAGTQTGHWGPIPPSNKRFELDFNGVFRLAGGKIAEFWITRDNLALLTQLGHWPPTQGAPPPASTQIRTAAISVKLTSCAIFTRQSVSSNDDLSYLSKSASMKMVSRANS